MAAPMVSGVAALLFGAHPEATSANVIKAIVRGVSPNKSLAGYVASGGSVNAARALTVLDAMLAASPTKQ